MECTIYTELNTLKTVLLFMFEFVSYTRIEINNRKGLF